MTCRISAKLVHELRNLVSEPLSYNSDNNPARAPAATRHACHELHAERLFAHTAKYRVAVGTRCQNVNSLALHNHNFHDGMDSNILSCRVSNRSHTLQLIMVSKFTMPPAVFKLCACFLCFLPRTLPLMLPTYQPGPRHHRSSNCSIESTLQGREKFRIVLHPGVLSTLEA